MKAVELFSSLALLAAFTSGVEIQCSFDDYTVDKSDIYSCYTRVITLENPTTITKISGNHTAGKTNADVKGFRVWISANLTTIPTGVEKFFPNLEEFTWSGGSLTTIDSSTFKPFPNLLIIGLAQNKLTTLDDNLFQYTRKLQGIYFYGNKLEHVGLNLLTGLTKLLVGYFSANPCINIDASTPAQIQTLRTQLPIKCPPLAPTTTTTAKPNNCPTSCMDKIAELEKRIVKLEAKP